MFLRRYTRTIAGKRLIYYAGKCNHLDVTQITLQ